MTRLAPAFCALLLASACGNDTGVGDQMQNADPGPNGSAGAPVDTVGTTTGGPDPDPAPTGSPPASVPPMPSMTGPSGGGGAPTPVVTPGPSANAGAPAGPSGSAGAASGGAANGGSDPGAGGNGQSGGGSGGAPNPTGAAFPFPVNGTSQWCNYVSDYDPAVVRAAYDDWKATTVTSDGAGGFLRVWKPDSGTVIGSTVSEGIGYGMLLSVYMDDQPVFDGLWQYTLQYLNGNGLMHWEIDPEGNVIGTGGATDGDEDIAWALVMADRQWGGQGSLDRSYLEYAVDLIDAIWEHEVDHNRDYMLKAGDEWGDRDVTNPSYFAPAYYRVFGRVTGREEDWDRVVTSSYDIIERSLNAASGNEDNGLVPAWCTSAGVPTEAYGGAPLHYQQDSTRTPFRVGQDYCYFGEPRAKAYLEKITSFFQGVGVANIVDGYELDGTPRPERAMDGLQSASFVGPAGVGAMNDPMNQIFVDEAYAAVATLGLRAGTIYYQKSWTALSLIMLTGNFVDLTTL